MLNEKALLAAFRVNHHPDAEPSSVEIAQLSRSITAYLAAAAPADVRELVAEWRKDMEGVTPEHWDFTLCEDGRPMVHTDGDIICLPEPNHGSDGNLPDAMDVANFSWIARCSPSGISGLLDALLAMAAELEIARSVHRWSTFKQGDGVLRVCRGEHDKREECEWEAFTPIARAEAAEARLSEMEKALEPFAWVGQWFFARGIPDETAVVVFEGAGKPVALTRGMFKAAHTTLRAKGGNGNGW